MARMEAKTIHMGGGEGEGRRVREMRHLVSVITGQEVIFSGRRGRVGVGMVEKAWALKLYDMTPANGSNAR